MMVFIQIFSLKHYISPKWRTFHLTVNTHVNRTLNDSKLVRMLKFRRTVILRPCGFKVLNTPVSWLPSCFNGRSNISLICAATRVPAVVSPAFTYWACRQVFRKRAQWDIL